MYTDMYIYMGRYIEIDIICVYIFIYIFTRAHTQSPIGFRGMLEVSGITISLLCGICESNVGSTVASQTPSEPVLH